MLPWCLRVSRPLRCPKSSGHLIEQHTQEIYTLLWRVELCALLTSFSFTEPKCGEMGGTVKSWGGICHCCRLTNCQCRSLIRQFSGKHRSRTMFKEMLTPLLFISLRGWTETSFYIWKYFRKWACLYLLILMQTNIWDTAWTQRSALLKRYYYSLFEYASDEGRNKASSSITHRWLQQEDYCPPQDEWSMGWSCLLKRETSIKTVGGGWRGSPACSMKPRGTCNSTTVQILLCKVPQQRIVHDPEIPDPPPAQSGALKWADLRHSVPKLMWRLIPT